MIRQAISCDICGAEKRQTNHWFVAYEQAGELRVCSWSARKRQRTGTKHLCGQACMHKLADDFMMRVIAGKATQPEAQKALAEPAPVAAPEIRPAAETRTDTSLTSSAAYSESDEFESSARLIPAPAPLAKPALVPLPARMAPVEEPPRYATRNWQAEAWERERERSLRSGEHRAGSALRRVSRA